MGIDHTFGLGVMKIGGYLGIIIEVDSVELLGFSVEDIEMIHQRGPTNQGRTLGNDSSDSTTFPFIKVIPLKSMLGPKLSFIAVSSLIAWFVVSRSFVIESCQDID
jgi:hypothetical protein